MYIKLSDGTSARNEANYTGGAQAAGIKAGGYHYAEPGNAPAQADLFVNLCERYGATELAPALDLEAPFTPGAAAADFAIAFLRRVIARGHRPCLYGNNSMLSAVRAPVVAAVPGCLVWAARYGASPTMPYDLWQWSNKGSVPGITSSAVDLNKGVLPSNIAVPDDSGDDVMFLACVGFDPKYPSAVLYCIYSGGVLTGLSADSVNNGLHTSYYKDKVVWISAKDMQDLAQKSDPAAKGTS